MQDQEKYLQARLFSSENVTLGPLFMLGPHFALKGIGKRIGKRAFYCGAKRLFTPLYTYLPRLFRLLADYKDWAHC